MWVGISYIEYIECLGMCLCKMFELLWTLQKEYVKWMLVRRVLRRKTSNHYLKNTCVFKYVYIPYYILAETARWEYISICWPIFLETSSIPPVPPQPICSSRIEVSWKYLQEAGNVDKTWMGLTKKRIHPPGLIWNLKMKVWKMFLLFQGCILRFHVSFQGCKHGGFSAWLHLTKKVQGWLAELHSDCIFNALGDWIDQKNPSRTKAKTHQTTNLSLKIGLPKRNVVFQPSIFSGYVGFGECIIVSKQNPAAMSKLFFGNYPTIGS